MVLPTCAIKEELGVKKEGVGMRLVLKLPPKDNIPTCSG